MQLKVRLNEMLEQSCGKLAVMVILVTYLNKFEIRVDNI